MEGIRSVPIQPDSLLTEESIKVNELEETPVTSENRGSQIDLDNSLERENSEDEEKGPSTLVQEINAKYGTEQGLLSENSVMFIKIGSESPCKQLPGKRGASGSLELLALNDRQIQSPGDLCLLADLVSNVTELDLAKNSLSDWDQVILNHGKLGYIEISTLFACMPFLNHCNLSQNPFRREGLRAPVPPLPKMNSLVLNGTHVPWPTLFTFINSMPNLEELHLSLNDYGCDENLPGAEAAPFPNIHVLHINGCALQDWPSLSRILRLFPCLESLVAASNPIHSIGFHHPPQGAAEGTREWLEWEERLREELKESVGCLHALNLNRWSVKDWTQVDRLRHFPLLCELRINHIPLLEPYCEIDKRGLVVARLPEVTILNGSDVMSDQREDAERGFLRHYLPRDDKPKRYWELESIHGQVEPLVEVDLTPKFYAEVSLHFEDKKENIRLNLVQSVGEFKKRACQTFCGLSPARFRLFYLDHVVAAHIGMEELRGLKQMLFALNISDGDQFHIQAKPDPPRRRRTSSSITLTSPNPPPTSPTKP